VKTTVRDISTNHCDLISAAGNCAWLWSTFYV